MHRSAAIYFAVWIPLLVLTKTQPVVDHEFSRLGTIDSLVVRHNYYLEESRFHGSADRISYKGHSYSHQPPLLSTLEAPVFWVLHLAGLNFWNSAPFDLAYWLFTWLTSGVAIALTTVVLDSTLRVAGVDASTSAFSATALTLGNWLFPYALVVNNHVVSGLLVTCVAWSLMMIEKGHASMRIMAFLGASLGLLIAVEVIPIVSFVPISLVCLAMRPDLRSRSFVMAFAGAAFIPLLGHAVVNIGQTGDVIPGGFHNELFVYEALLMTNNFGGAAAGFRHAAYLGPAFVILLLPVLASEGNGGRIAVRVIIGTAVCSALCLALVVAPRPWYPYKFPPETPVVKSWDAYFPVVSYVTRRLKGEVDEFGKPTRIPKS